MQFILPGKWMIEIHRGSEAKLVEEKVTQK